MKKVIKIITNNKKVHIANPQLLVWLIFPVLSLYSVTHYFFGNYNNKVLGVNTEVKTNIATETPTPIINRFQSVYKNDGKGVVSIIFTGAYKTQIDIAYPELKSRGLNAAVSIPINAIGYPESMTWLNVRFLYTNGWEIISQSRDQICKKEDFNNTVLDSEINGSKEDLTGLGFTTNIYLPPCGTLTPDVIKRVSEKYNGLITFDIETNNASKPDKYNLIARQVTNMTTIKEVQKWINDAKTTHTWLILSFPDISDAKSMNDVSKELFLKTIQEVVKSKIQVALPSDILDQK